MPVHLGCSVALVRPRKWSIQPLRMLLLHDIRGISGCRVSKADRAALEESCPVCSEEWEYRH